MSYRRLPNTDKARLKTLKTAYKKGCDLSPVDLAFSQKIFNELRVFLPVFEKAYIDYNASYKIQIENNKTQYLPKLNKARIYIVHFIKVLIMAVERGDLPENSLDFFGLKSQKIPVLSSEDKIFYWGNKIIEGESERMARGLKPVTNPTFGIVRVYFDNFVEEYRKQKKLQENTARFLNILANNRDKANSIIKNIWDQLDKYFSNVDKAERESKLSDYGVILYSKKQSDKNSTSGKPKKTSKILVDYSLPFSFL